MHAFVGMQDQLLEARERQAYEARERLKAFERQKEAAAEAEEKTQPTNDVAPPADKAQSDPEYQEGSACTYCYYCKVTARAELGGGK